MAFVLRRQEPLSRPDPSAKVLAGDDVFVHRQVADVIADAWGQHAHIVAQARQVREDEARRGYAQGSERARLDQTGAMLAVVAQASRYFGRVEEQLAAIVLRAVRTVLDDYAERDRVLGLVRQALGEVRTQRHVTLRVHPDTAAHVRERLGELTRAYPAIECVDVVDDARVAGDACAVESEIGIVEASVAGQLAALEQAFKGAFDDRR